MKKITLSLALLLSTLIASNVQAASSGVYIGAKAGGSLLHAKILTDDIDTAGSFTGGIAVGYDFMPMYDFPVRAELEYLYSSEAKFDHGYGFDTKISVQTLMANAYYDWHNSTNFVPYLSLGLGLGFTETKHNWFDLDNESQTGFAFNVGVGTSYNITQNFALDIGYRLTYLDKVGSDGSGNAYSNSFLAGVRYTF